MEHQAEPNQSEGEAKECTQEIPWIPLDFVVFQRSTQKCIFIAQIATLTVVNPTSNEWNLNLLPFHKKIMNAWFSESAASDFFPFIFNLFMMEVEMLTDHRPNIVNQNHLWKT